MKRYKYNPEPVWGDMKVMSSKNYMRVINNFFAQAENSNDPDCILLRENIDNNNWDLVFYFWEHNFDSSGWNVEVLAKFLDECGIDFIKYMKMPREFDFASPSIIQVEE